MRNKREHVEQKWDLNVWKKNLIDIIKEEQAKLGFRKEEIRLYYPLISLNHFFEADDDVDEMQTRLEQFPEEVKEKTRRYLCDA